MNDKLIFILSIPLIILFYGMHLIEEIRIKTDIFKDRLFMKRFHLIDELHVRDLVDWNIKYRENRSIPTERKEG